MSSRFKLFLYSWISQIEILTMKVVHFRHQMRCESYCRVLRKMITIKQSRSCCYPTQSNEQKTKPTEPWIVLPSSVISLPERSFSRRKGASCEDKRVSTAGYSFPIHWDNDMLFWTQRRDHSSQVFSRNFRSNFLKLHHKNDWYHSKTY